MPVSSVSASLAYSSSARAEVPLTQAQRQAITTLQRIEDQLTVTTQRLATNPSGRGQIVNILT